MLQALYKNKHLQYLFVYGTIRVKLQIKTGGNTGVTSLSDLLSQTLPIVKDKAVLPKSRHPLSYWWKNAHQPIKMVLYGSIWQHMGFGSCATGENCESDWAKDRQQHWQRVLKFERFGHVWSVQCSVFSVLCSYGVYLQMYNRMSDIPRNLRPVMVPSFCGGQVLFFGVGQIILHLNKC